MTEKYGKCEKCGKQTMLEIEWYQEHGETNAYFVCKECREKREKEREMTRQNYQAQFGKDWH